MVLKILILILIKIYFKSCYKVKIFVVFLKHICMYNYMLFGFRVQHIYFNSYLVVTIILITFINQFCDIRRIPCHVQKINDLSYRCNLLHHQKAQILLARNFVGYSLQEAKISNLSKSFIIIYNTKQNDVCPSVCPSEA